MMDLLFLPRLKANEPQVGSNAPVSILKVVLLPAPFNPNQPKHCNQRERFQSSNFRLHNSFEFPSEIRREKRISPPLLLKLFMRMDEVSKETAVLAIENRSIL